MKKDWNSHIGAKNPVCVTPAKPAPEVSSPGAGGPVTFALNSTGWEKAWIPALLTSKNAGMTKSLAIFKRFSHQRTLFHHPARAEKNPFRIENCQ